MPSHIVLGGEALDIHIEHVAKSYRLGQVDVIALQDVTLQLPAGDFVSLSGPSGAGKSTLLGIIGGLERPDAGKILAGEQDLTALDSEGLAMYRRHSVGFIFQSFRLLPALTALENVMIPLVPLVESDEAKQKQVIEALDRVNIAHRAGHLPGELSGGEQQRVAIARAIVNGPNVILADEPTGELDRRNGELIMQLLRELNQSGAATIVVASHDPDVVGAARRQVKMEDGRVVAETA
ncbi:MAG: ABC transporter ATP-binding protein [Armatimonadetes bacterium]|nr:ABC transporter ATP-binding protein [Armatimonadota bacterium]